MVSSYKTKPVVALLVAGFLSSASAAVVPSPARRASITALTTAQINAFTPYTHYAGIGYCKPAVTLAWSCGANCEANPTFEPIAAGGDGDETQYCRC